LEILIMEKICIIFLSEIGNFAPAFGPKRVTSAPEKLKKENIGKKLQIIDRHH